MSRINQLEDEEKLALREKNWNTRFVLGKIPNFDAYNDINYLSLGLLKSKLRYEERIKKQETSKYNERLYSANYTKSKSYAKQKYKNNMVNNIKKGKMPSVRLYLNTSNNIKNKNNKKDNAQNVYNYPYQGTLTSYNLAGSPLFKYNPDYKDKQKNHNYIDYICKEDEEISDEYYFIKELWEKLGVTENYINNFELLLNNKYKNRDEILEMLKGEKKQMKQFRIEFMKVLSEINKRESKIKDLKDFIKIYGLILKKEKKYKNTDDVKLKEIKDAEIANKERTEDDIHECLKSLRLRTINTFNAIQKFKKNYEHYFFNKIDLEILEEKYGYNPYYLNKLKNDLDFLRDSPINCLYHFSENGGDPFLLCISDLCGNINDAKNYKQVRISEEVLSVVKKYMFYLEQEDVFKMTRKKSIKNNNNIKNYNSYNNYGMRTKNKIEQNYFNNEYPFILKRVFDKGNKYDKFNQNDINENLLSKNFKGNLEKEKLRLKAQNEYQNLFFNTEEKKYLRTKELPTKTIPTDGNKIHIPGMTSKQLIRKLDNYGKIRNELLPSTNKDKLKEKVKKNIVKNIEDRMKKVEIEFRLKMDEKYKKEQNKIKEEEKRLKTEKEKFEKLCIEEENERKKKEEKYNQLEKQIEERKQKDKKISEENEKFEKREKAIFVKEMQQKFMDEVEERFKKEDEKQILFKKELIQEAEKREKHRKDEIERIRHDDFEKVKRTEIVVDLRESKKKQKNKKSSKKKKRTKKSDEGSNEEEDEEEEEDDDEEEEENDEEENQNEESSNKKYKNNNNKFTSENDDITSDNINNNKRVKKQKDSSNSNDDISEDLEEEES